MLPPSHLPCYLIPRDNPYEPDASATIQYFATPNITSTVKAALSFRLMYTGHISLAQPPSTAVKLEPVVWPDFGGTLVKSSLH
jgi:hypothetical protein